MRNNETTNIIFKQFHSLARAIFSRAAEEHGSHDCDSQELCLRSMHQAKLTFTRPYLELFVSFHSPPLLVR